MALIPALGERQVGGYLSFGQPVLERYFQDSQDYTQKHCLENKCKKVSWYEHTINVATCMSEGLGSTENDLVFIILKL